MTTRAPDWTLALSFDPRRGDHYVLASNCPPSPTTTKWDTFDDAVKAYWSLNQAECGGQCAQEHSIIHVHQEPTGGWKASVVACRACELGRGRLH